VSSDLSNSLSASPDFGSISNHSAYSTSLGNSGLCWTIFARNRDTAVPVEGNGDCVLVARPRRCLTLSNPVPWQNWMAALSRLHSADKDDVSWLTSYGSWHAYEKNLRAWKITSEFRTERSLSPDFGSISNHSAYDFTFSLTFGPSQNLGLNDSINERLI